jgi:hypothetical protein
MRSAVATGRTKGLTPAEDAMNASAALSAQAKRVSTIAPKYVEAKNGLELCISKVQ